MQRPREFSLVLEIPAASPDEANAHFAAKLSVETDISDLMFDLQRGYEGFVLLDVRDQASFEVCHIPSAIHLPARRIDGDTTRGIPKEKAVVVYCWGPGCNGATKAALALSKLGFRVKELIGAGSSTGAKRVGASKVRLQIQRLCTGRDLSGPEKPNRPRDSSAPK